MQLPLVVTMRKRDKMRQKEVKERLSQEFRDLHHIEVEKHIFHLLSNPSSAYIGFPTSLIESIDEDAITIHLNLREGVLALWKKYPSAHLTLFDRKARDRRLARERKKRR